MTSAKNMNECSKLNEDINECVNAYATVTIECIQHYKHKSISSDFFIQKVYARKRIFANGNDLCLLFCGITAEAR